MTVARCVRLGLLCCVMGLGLLSVGCDQVSPVSDEGPPPQVSSLAVTPDTVRGPAGADTTTVTVDVLARAEAPNGTVERVVFTLEPTSNPRSTLSDTLASQGGDTYGLRLELTLPVLKELYSVRVFAVGDEGQASNQVVGQFQFVPTP